MIAARIDAAAVNGKWWFGDLPKEWKIVRAKWTLSQIKGGVWGEDTQGNEWDIPCVRIADFDRLRAEVGSEIPTIRQVEPGLRHGRVLSRGDLVIEKSGGGDNQPVGFVALYVGDQPAVCSNFTTRGQVHPNYEPSFVRYVHMALYSARRNVQHIRQTSGIQNLDISAYLNELVPGPPLEEQCRIAAFLDYETARIDELVHEQERLKELLTEKHRATVEHAVMSGKVPTLPSFEMRRVKIATQMFLMPKHWQFVPVKRAYEVRLGKMLQSVSSSAADQLRPYLRAINIQSSGVDFNDVRSMWFKPGEFEELRLQPGDLLVSEGGDVGRSAIFHSYSEDVAIQNAINRVRPRVDASTQFLHYWIQTVKQLGYIDVLCNRATIPHFTAEKLAALEMPFPPAREQHKIADFLNNEVERLHDLHAEQDKNIELLLERRSALISAAVTGQLNLRDWQPPDSRSGAEVA